MPKIASSTQPTLTSEKTADEPIIHTTTNYDQFKRMTGNREYYMPHLRDLEKSILEKDMLKYNPMIVNEKMEIIEGQHRLLIAKENHLPIYYLVMPGGNLEDVRRHTGHQRSWTVADFLESYIKEGNEKYRELKDFCIKYHLPVSAALTLFNGGDFRSTLPGGSIRDFKDGKLALHDKDYAYRMAEQFQEIKPFLDPPSIETSRPLLHALILAYRSIDHTVFIDKLAQSGIKIRYAGSIRDYLRQIEDVYNFQSRQPIRLF